MRFDRCLAAMFVFALGGPAVGQASSHREAPAIAEDPTADNTDVYAFISPFDPNNLVVIANYVPLLLPASGPNFYQFSDDVRYEIHFDNDGDATTDITYRFEFETTFQNGDTFLYNTGPIASLTDPNLNVRQTYDVRRLERPSDVGDLVASDVPVAPWHVGDRSFPQGSYEGIARQAIVTADGVGLFAGPRDEPFFVDLHVFDLLGVGGAPTTDGLNVMSIVLEVPITELTSDGTRTPDSASADSILGVHATASRRRLRILRSKRAQRDFGRFVQVSRLALPLINEVVVPLGDKDQFNRSQPQDDLLNFGQYILSPELPDIINAVGITTCPPPGPDGRLDLVDLLAPNGTFPADLLRINVAADQTFADTSFPNGRWLEDDVVDTLLTVICNNQLPLGDGVDGNDLPFGSAFPYLASPHSGNPLR